MEINEFHNNYIINTINLPNKNLTPSKEYQIFQSNGIICKDNLQNIQNTFFNNSLSLYATPKKDFHQLDQGAIISPLVSNSKVEIPNNILLNSLRKNSINNLSPFKPLITPYNNSQSRDKT